MIQIRVLFLVAIIIVLAIIISFILLAYKTFIQRIIREKNKQYQLEIMHQKKMLELSISIQESERKRIATLLHDDVGNKLNILSVWFNNPETWNSERSKEVISKQIPDLIETTRNISHTLYPANLERLGLILAIDELIANVNSSLSVRMILIHEYTPGELAIEVQLYRIIQEFLSNVLKHAKATEMLIHIRDSAHSLCVILSDNGKGFETSMIKRGMGLGNIEFRMNSLNAVYKWKSAINKGCKLIVSIPKK